MEARDAMNRSTATSTGVEPGMLKRHARETAAIPPLTTPEWTALARIDREGPITAAGLARSQQIPPQAMGSTVAY